MTPAPISRTTDSATSQMMSSRRVRRPTEPASLRPPSFSASFRSVRPARIAGIAPARMAVRIDAAATNSRTRASMEISSARGTWPDSNVAPAVRLVRASRRPAAPPPIASTSASISSCWNTRARPAPSAERIAISLRRPSARAKSRLPTFAHAISSTSATAASSITSDIRMSPTISSCSGMTVAPQPAFSCGKSRSSRVEISSISDVACAAATPGLRRATTCAL